MSKTTKKFKTPEKICQHSIELANGPHAVARLFNPKINGQAVSQWKRIPPARCVALSIEIDGFYQPHEMCPDVFPVK